MVTVFINFPLEYKYVILMTGLVIEVATSNGHAD